MASLFLVLLSPPPPFIFTILFLFDVVLVVSVASPAGGHGTIARPPPLSTKYERHGGERRKETTG